ncbi:hypothetical protein [Streptomyces parvulus]|uniref:hypothetical protein n=1 Tax=Streptomyces parvulus TaxID=146923 RepID=UPI00367F4E1E
MTPSEIQMLVIGLALGAQATQITYTIAGARAARRAAAAARAIAKRSAGDRYLSSLELYRVQQRYGLTP